MGYHRVFMDRGLCLSRRSDARHLPGDLASPGWRASNDWDVRSPAASLRPAPSFPCLPITPVEARAARARVSTQQATRALAPWRYLMGLPTNMTRYGTTGAASDEREPSQTPRFFVSTGGGEP